MRSSKSQGHGICQSNDTEIRTSGASFEKIRTSGPKSALCPKPKTTDIFLELNVSNYHADYCGLKT